MSVVAANNLCMGFLDEVLFENANFEIEEKDKAGLIGANGSGKTTLFKLITGEYEPTDGKLFVSSKANVGYVQQHACSDPDKTSREEMLSVFDYLFELEQQLNSANKKVDHYSKTNDPLLHEAIDEQLRLTEEFQDKGGLTFRSRAESMLSGLGFTENEKNLTVGNLSGGQRTKISLGKLLLSNLDFILLDEPTNHLDIKSIQWLEDYLKAYNGTILVVSHDRYFLDAITNKTIEIEHKKILVHQGNYSRFMQLKQEEKKALERKYEQQLRETKRIQGIIDQQKRFNQERNYITIASKQKQLDRIKEEMVEPDKDEKTIRIKFESGVTSGNDVLMVNSLSKSYGDKVLFKNISFNVYKGDKIFIIGENGCGKSTLLQCILGKIQADSGLVSFGANVRYGYFEQIQSSIKSTESVLNYLYNIFPAFTISELRGYLGAFEFRNDSIEKQMCDLSGGERARISFLSLMLKKPNFLILDEPTNHLDIPSKERLEDALVDYDGTILCVSHDRFLINRLATKIIVLSNSDVKFFDGSYDDYCKSLSGKFIEKAKPIKKPNEYLLKKQRESELRKKQTQIKRLEEQIEENSNKQQSLRFELEKPEVQCDYEKISSITSELDELMNLDDELMNEWARLTDE